MAYHCRSVFCLNPFLIRATFERGDMDVDILRVVVLIPF